MIHLVQVVDPNLNSKNIYILHIDLADLHIDPGLILNKDELSSYLFKSEPQSLSSQGCVALFVGKVFKNWKKTSKLKHEGKHNSAYNRATQQCENLIKLVERRNYLVYPLVYILIILALTLPFANASIESIFRYVDYEVKIMQSNGR